MDKNSVTKKSQVQNISAENGTKTMKWVWLIKMHKVANLKHTIHISPTIWKSPYLESLAGRSEKYSMFDTFPLIGQRKVQLEDCSFLRNRGHYFKKNCTYLVSLCLHELVGDTIVDGWPQFECNFDVFADMILPYGSHCIDMTASPEPINGITGTWLSCFATCDWLRALMHLHCDVMIQMTTTKTWWFVYRWGLTYHAYGRKFAIKIQC